jgi:hypothetical protein
LITQNIKADINFGIFIIRLKSFVVGWHDWARYHYRCLNLVRKEEKIERKKEREIEGEKERLKKRLKER